jgi:hypothetical protein
MPDASMTLTLDVESTADCSLDSLRLAWCSDCLSDELFEGAADDDSADGSGEWACTGCGAAYFDAIDSVLDVGAQDARGVA